jgi:predicted transcriptional regulator
MDPSDLEARYSEDDSLAQLDSIFTEPTEDDLAQIEEIRDVLDHLPPREADFIDLYYFRKLRQTDIATIFGVSQPTVCYRSTRAAARVRFLLERPVFDQDVLISDLTGFLMDPLDIQIMLLMWQTTCQSEVAKRLGVTQGLVRHRFLRSVNHMRGNPSLDKYVKLFDYITDNLNILREVQRPNWGDSMTFCIR